MWRVSRYAYIILRQCGPQITLESSQPYTRLLPSRQSSASESLESPVVPDSSIIQREKQEDLRFTAIPRLKVLLGLVFHFWFTPSNRVSFGKSWIPVYE